MLKKPFFVGLFILLFIGLSDYSYACHGGKPPHEGCGGVVDGLKANLTGGTFVLDNPVTVNLDKKGRIFTSRDDLGMTRQDEPFLEVDWNAVFEECRVTMPFLEIPTDIQFGDDWRIAANAGLILLRLFDARVNLNAVISLSLLGDSDDYVGKPIPPDEFEISHFELDRWEIFGGTERGVQPRDSCHLKGVMIPSILSICGTGVPVEDCHFVN